MSGNHARCATISLLGLLLATPTAALAQDADAPVFQPVALVQVWATAWDQDRDAQADPAGYGDPEDDPGFKIRRARIGATGDLGHGLSYKVVFGAASPYDAWSSSDTDIGLVDGSFGYTNGDFDVAVGQQKVPYSREQLISASQLVYTERAVVTEHMVPGRETGLVAGYTWKGLGLLAGVFNGSGSFLGDDNLGLLSAARLSYTNSEAGEDMTTWGEVDGLVFGVAGNGFYNDDLSTSTMSAGGDAIVRIAGLSALVEAHFATIKPTSTDVAPADVLAGTARSGMTGQLGYSIGAFENALRFSMYDDNGEAEDNGDIWELYGGTTVHLADDHARLGLGYVHRHELAGQSLPNDTIRLWVQGKY